MINLQSLWFKYLSSSLVKSFVSAKFRQVDKNTREHVLFLFLFQVIAGTSGHQTKRWCFLIPILVAEL